MLNAYMNEQDVPSAKRGGSFLSRLANSGIIC